MSTNLILFPTSRPRNTVSREPLVNKKPMGRALRMLEPTKERIARDWDRGVRIRSLASMHTVTTADIDDVLWEMRGRRLPVGPDGLARPLTQKAA